MAKLKSHLALLGLDLRKELLGYGLCSFCFIAAMLALVFLKTAVTYWIIPPAAWLFFTYFYFGRYAKAINKQEARLVDEFVHLFTFFGVYIHNGYNVYTALQAIQAYASEAMKTRLVALCEGIESDKSITPYVEFAKDFPDVSIKQVMVSIYEMVDEGQGGVYVRQFERLFGRLSESKHQLEKAMHRESLDRVAFFPLIASAASILLLSFCLVRILEASINVI
ncbi:MAG: hypothetical protein HUJ60_03100 [Bacilli bacterium]|nr:hypothetical protein [Bacilli bacterium]